MASRKRASFPQMLKVRRKREAAQRKGKQVTTALLQQDEGTSGAAVGALLDRRVRRPAIRDYSEQELLAELSRRRALRMDNKPTKWCDECAHFAPSDEPKLTKDPCAKNHATHFLMPESAGDYEWGYYRRWCRDWTPNVEITG